MIDLKILIWIIVCWNSLLFILVGADKYKAKKGNFRIPERTLILSALLFGWLGVWTGMKVFHHKTKKRSFKMMIFIALLFNLIILLICFYLIKIT